VFINVDIFERNVQTTTRSASTSRVGDSSGRVGGVVTKTKVTARRLLGCDARGERRPTVGRETHTGAGVEGFAEYKRRGAVSGV
jgi:hypothetical protein